MLHSTLVPIGHDHEGSHVWQPRAHTWGDGVVEDGQPIDTTTLLVASSTTRHQHALLEWASTSLGSREGELCLVATEACLAIQDT
jgi:hypothetical protein